MIFHLLNIFKGAVSLKKLIRIMTLISCSVLIVACANSPNNNDSSSNDQFINNEQNNRNEQQSSNNRDNNETNKLDNDDNLSSNFNNDQSNDGEYIDKENEQNTIVLENEAFKIYGPDPVQIVNNELVVKGLARVFEAFVEYSLEDGHFIYEKGTVRAASAAPNWSDFTIKIPFNDENKDATRLVIFEESAKDGSPIHELIIELN